LMLPSFLFCNLSSSSYPFLSLLAYTPLADVWSIYNYVENIVNVLFSIKHENFLVRFHFL
jgi:hypothetical protein